MPVRAAKGGPEIVPCALAREACQSTRSSNCIMLVLPAQRTSPLEATAIVPRVPRQDRSQGFGGLSTALVQEVIMFEQKRQWSARRSHQKTSLRGVFAGFAMATSKSGHDVINGNL